MKYHLNVPEEVYEEVEKAGEYYHLQQPGLEMELFEEWEQALQRLVKAPEGLSEKEKELSAGHSQAISFYDSFRGNRH